MPKRKRVEKTPRPKRSVDELVADSARLRRLARDLSERTDRLAGEIVARQKETVALQETLALRQQYDERHAPP